MIDNKVINTVAKQYLARKVKWLNKKLAGTGTIRFEDASPDGRKYSGWIQEDKAFADGARWAIRMMEKDADYDAVEKKGSRQGVTL